jgi:hypothetical protein
MNYKYSFLHTSAGRRVGQRLVTEAQQFSIFIVATCNMIRCSHRGSILWMYWQYVTLVDSMAPTLICYLARWSSTLQKQAFFLSFVKLKFFLSKTFDKIFSTQVYPSSFNLKKLGWGDSRTASTSCHSELSVTEDTAKYLVFNTLQRLCTFPTRLSHSLFPGSSFCIKWAGGDQDEIFRKQSLRPTRTRSHLSSLTTLCPSGWVLVA